MLVRSLLAASSWLSLALVARAQSSDGGDGQSALPQITAGSTQSCGGCYVVADVADVVFGNEHLTQTDTVVVSVATAFNGTTRFTSTTVGEVPFTFGPSGVFGSAGGGGIINYGNSTAVIGGVTLTSPTQYLVFTAYSLTSSVVTNGNCVAVLGAVSSLDTAISFALDVNAGPGALASAEDAFARSVGFPTCSAAGANVNSQTQSIISTLTTTSSVTGGIRPTPQALSTTVASSTTTSSSSSSSSSSSAAASSSTSSSSTSTSTTIISSTATIVIVSNATSTTPVATIGTVVPQQPTVSMMPFPGTGAALSVPSWLAWIAGAIGLVMWA